MVPELSDETWELGVISQVDGCNPSPYKRPGRRVEVKGAEIEPEECDPMKGWVTVGGRKACQEETETEEKSTPEEERRKEMFKYPYLTWFLRTQEEGEKVEKKCKEILRQEKLEEEMRKRLRDNKSKVEEWLMREGLGSSEIESILYP